MTLEETLAEQELTFLRKLATGTRWMLRDGKASTKIQSLIERGYCRTSPERLGPLGVYTGEVCIFLTEAGRTIVANAESSQPEDGMEA